MVRRSNDFVRFWGYVRPYTKYSALGVVGGMIKFTVPLPVPQVAQYLLDGVFLNSRLSGEEQLRTSFLYADGTVAWYKRSHA